MTNKSAIVIIKAMITTHKSLEAQGINSDVPFDKESIEALNMAIDSLKKPNIHGHWELDESDNSVTCDKCGCSMYLNDIMNGDGHFCPNCGADMRGK